jgi:hypothetical protein
VGDGASQSLYQGNEKETIKLEEIVCEESEAD